MRCSRQDFSQNASTYEEEQLTSQFGHLLIDSAWLPAPDRGFVKPSGMSLDDLPDSFTPDARLADQLGKDPVAKLAKQVGVPVEDIELLKQHPGEFQEWKATLTAKTERPDFPTRLVLDPERREIHIAEQLENAPEKKYEERNRSVRITDDEIRIQARLMLKDYYTNDDKMICQICGKEMPFRKRDGEYYFVAVEALSRAHFAKEHKAQFLALCPLCEAMYKEFVICDEIAMETLKTALMSSQELQAPVRLGELNTSIRFVESHWQDIRTILQALS